MMADLITFKVAQGKTIHSLSLPVTSSVKDVKEEITQRLGIDPGLQKLLFKGILQDKQSLEQAGIKEGCKVILMASNAKDILQVATAPTNSAVGSINDIANALAAIEPLSKQTVNIYIYISKLEIKPFPKATCENHCQGQTSRL